MFYSFSSQDKRREINGSDFYEFQFCKMPFNSEIKEIVAVKNIKNWSDDSLYVNGNDHNEFIREYGEIFNCGIYNDLRSGKFDPCGINYYKPEFIDPIIEKISSKRPADSEKIIAWFSKAKKYNGFYILGI